MPTGRVRLGHLVALAAAAFGLNALALLGTHLAEADRAAADVMALEAWEWTATIFRILLGTADLALIAVCFVWLRDDVSRPLERLGRLMAGVRRRGSVKMAYRGRVAEIGQLADAYDFMARRIDAMQTDHEAETHATGLAFSTLVDALDDVTRLNRQAVALNAELAGKNERLRRQYHELKELKELDRLKSNFVNAVSHELRTPLTSIRGYAELLEDGVGGELAPAHRDFVTQIARGALRLENLVNDPLDYARMEAGTFQLNPEWVDFGDTARETIDLLKPLAEEADVHLTLELPDEPLRLKMDPCRVGQVLTNLVSNAIKHTPAGGDIQVRAQTLDDHLRFEVADTGEGIAAQDLPRLFQRFSQVGPGGPRVKGVGLGLAISKNLVEAHAGEIGVASQLGRGSVFWVELPVDHAAAVGA